MLSAPFLLVLHLPPLVFGPALPPPAFEPPRELTCDIHRLGRPEPLLPPMVRAPGGPTLALGELRTDSPHALIHPAVDALLVMGALALTHGSWSNASWEDRRWEAIGGITPVLIPPLAPPARVQLP